MCKKRKLKGTVGGHSVTLIEFASNTVSDLIEWDSVRIPVSGQPCIVGENRPVAYAGAEDASQWARFIHAAVLYGEHKRIRGLR